MTATAPAPVLDEQRQRWAAAATATVHTDLLRDTAVELASIPSPPGEEAALARYLVARAGDAGIAADYQSMDATAGNALLRIDGTGDGASLMLYAPIDTHATGDAALDCPQVAETLRPDMLPRGRAEGDFVLGLGANNPKGHAACVLAAVEAVRRAEVPLRGDLLAGFAAGGMPTNQRAGSRAGRRNIGHGVGCSYLIEQGGLADYAVIAKTGWSVSWEEVGLAWVRIRVRGRHNYVGIRHFTPYLNPIVAAAPVIEALEAWFPGYSERHRSGLVAPQAGIGAIEGGWPHSPAFNPAVCDLYLDVRLSPRTTPLAVLREVRAAVAGIAAARELDVSCELVTAVRGTSTDPDSWVVRSAVRAWEAVAGQPHEARPGTSGATDANILRARGIPTARIGMPPVPDHAPVPADFSRGMNVVHVPDMLRLTEALIQIVVDTCTRPRAEVTTAGEGSSP
jgi:acetylornithine deacetylase/succinyl-diaminopimelate desuccinylase-like protein